MPEGGLSWNKLRLAQSHAGGPGADTLPGLESLGHPLMHLSLKNKEVFHPKSGLSSPHHPTLCPSFFYSNYRLRERGLC